MVLYLEIGRPENASQFPANPDLFPSIIHYFRLGVSVVVFL